MDFKVVKKELINKLSKNVDNANQEFAFLCQAKLGLSGADLIIKEEINKKDYLVLKKAVKKRLKGIPLQLIIGTSDFLGVEIIESKHALKPRPETMLLAEHIINNVPMDRSVLDMCTGSGCIGLALKKAGFEEVTLSDISCKAIKCALRNAKHNGLSVTLVKSDMFKEIVGVYDIITINPPYIESADIKTLQKEVKKYDPMKALDGGADGLKFYRIIADNAHKYLTDKGLLYLEIGINQEKDIINLLEKNFKNITIIKDYNNINRIIRAEK